MEPFEGRLSRDTQGSGDRADAVFVALGDDEVVGCAKLAMSSRSGYVLHDMTGVKRRFCGHTLKTVSFRRPRG